MTEAIGMDTEHLQATAQVLQLLFHHNKNQHRRSPWLKWLATLKRNASHLIQDIEQSESRTIALRIDWCEEHIFPRCHIAFSQLVQDSQFAPLGITLLAELAHVQSLFANLANGLLPARRQVATVQAVSLSITTGEQDDEVGEAVPRDSVSGVWDHDAASSISQVEQVTNEEDGSMSTTSTGACHMGLADQTTSSGAYLDKRQKKKSWSRNVIDDIFAGLS